MREWKRKRKTSQRKWKLYARPVKLPHDERIAGLQVLGRRAGEPFVLEDGLAAVLLQPGEWVLIVSGNAGVSVFIIYFMAGAAAVLLPAPSE